MSKRTKYSPTPLPVPNHAPILLVDDDEDIREVVTLLLEDAGYAVTALTNVADAQDHLSAASCAHVVLLDFRLAGANADALLQVIDQDATLQRHRFVLMPASSVTQFCDEAQRLIAAYCTEVVSKPFDVEHLLTAVQRASTQLPPDRSRTALQ
jgi:DNA-binding NtrC family response regulator